MALILIMQFVQLLVMGFMLFYLIELQKDFDEFQTDFSMVVFNEESEVFDDDY